MIAPEYDRLISFQSIHEAIRAQQLFEQAGITVKAVPTPRDIDISCGVCILYQSTQETWLYDLANQAQVVWSRRYDRRVDQGKYILLEVREKGD